MTTAPILDTIRRTIGEITERERTIAELGLALDGLARAQALQADAHAAMADLRAIMDRLSAERGGSGGVN